MKLPAKVSACHAEITRLHAEIEHWQQLAHYRERDRSALLQTSQDADANAEAWSRVARLALGLAADEILRRRTGKP
jgi:hypothetical protein